MLGSRESAPEYLDRVRAGWAQIAAEVPAPRAQILATLLDRAAEVIAAAGEADQVGLLLAIDLGTLRAGLDPVSGDRIRRALTRVLHESGVPIQRHAAPRRYVTREDLLAGLRRDDAARAVAAATPASAPAMPPPPPSPPPPPAAPPIAPVPPPAPPAAVTAPVETPRRLQSFAYPRPEPTEADDEEPAAPAEDRIPKTELSARTGIVVAGALLLCAAIAAIGMRSGGGAAPTSPGPNGSPAATLLDTTVLFDAGKTSCGSAAPLTGNQCSLTVHLGSTAPLHVSLIWDSADPIAVAVRDASGHSVSTETSADSGSSTLDIPSLDPGDYHVLVTNTHAAHGPVHVHVMVS